MQDMMLSFYVKTRTLCQALEDESGQDLVEYALVLVLVCLALTAGMGTLASGINTAMTGVGGKLSTYLGT